VIGTLEILRRGELFHTRPQTRYVIQYPQGLSADEVHLYYRHSPGQMDNARTGR